MQPESHPNGELSSTDNKSWLAWGLCLVWDAPALSCPGLELPRPGAARAWDVPVEAEEAPIGGDLCGLCVGAGLRSRHRLLKVEVVAVLTVAHRLQSEWVGV